MRARLGAWLLLPLLLAACGDEDPLAIGSQLLPPDALRSFEVTLDAEQFLVSDTSFGVYSEVGASEYMLLARDYGGVVNAHEFVRFLLPGALSVVDSAGRTVIDSAFTVLRGEVIVTVDTVASPVDPTVFVALHALGEEWDPTAADWEFRREATAWTTPGGTVGALLSSIAVTRDSVFLPVDSATLRTWADTTNELRGARLSLAAGPARIRAAQHPRLRIFASSTHHPDTTFTVTVAPFVARYDYRPRLATSAPEARVAGAPAWRAFLQLRTDLGELVVSCGTGCTIALKDAAITRAELVLQPGTPPPGFDPELSVQPTAYEALVAPAFPLARTPLGQTLGSVYAPIDPADFTAGGEPAYLLITEFIRQLVLENEAPGGSPFAGTGWLVLQHTGAGTFGIGAFEPSPRLRLVLSTAREIQLP